MLGRKNARVGRGRGSGYPYADRGILAGFAGKLAIDTLERRLIGIHYGYH